MHRIEVVGAVNLLWLAAFLLIRYLAEEGPATAGAAGAGSAAGFFGWVLPTGLVLFLVAWGGYAIGRAAARRGR
ncbi:hypothetical protein [Thermaerobacter subterraneus]|uniref:Uncharacterized protein n=1 Tax=Thermaerobacter subterraneus DSM 13965 TaxID=867903 RepID=K6PMM6_9FIRM|nr:hypothetical protein [Thermaerobacter subterraneus]EKP94142.1 hypothetical protein ThesuDRAFT_01871 [Thermaerobacter subterraneus DSM 13965]